MTWKGERKRSLQPNVVFGVFFLRDHLRSNIIIHLLLVLWTPLVFLILMCQHIMFLRTVTTNEKKFDIPNHSVHNREQENFEHLHFSLPKGKYSQVVGFVSAMAWFHWIFSHVTATSAETCIACYLAFIGFP